MLHERSARVIESLAEAERFAERIKILREKHSITQEIVLDEEDEFGALDDFDGEFVFPPDSPLFKRKRIIWEEQLFNYVTDYFGCRSVYYKNCNLKAVVGEKATREKVIKSYLYLHETALKLMEDFTKEVESNYENFSGEIKRFARASFQHGFVNGIFDRLSNFKRLEMELKKWQKHLGGEVTAQIEQGLIKSEKIVSTKKREKIEEDLSQIPVMKAPSEINIDENAFLIGMQKGHECELPDEIAKPAIENYEKLTEIQENIRREQQSRYRVTFYYSSSSTADAYYAPVQMPLIFDE